MPGPITPSLRPTDGWKLHLGAAPEHHAAIEGELQGMVARGEVAHYKRGLGAGQDGKDFTVYAGHRDSADAAAGSLHTRVGHLLSPPGADVLADDLPLAGNVHGRFDVGGSDPAFHQYGSRGVPYHAEDMGNLTFAPPAERPGLADAARTRAHASLAAKYGDFYSGASKAPSPPAMGPLDWQALKRFAGDESGALKVPIGRGGEMPDFASQQNMSDNYRLSPSTGVPKTRSSPPPIGGARVQPPGGPGYDLGAQAPSRPIPSRPAPPAPPPRPPTPPKYSSGDDLVAAYAKMSAGFPQDAPMAMHVHSPEALAGVGSAETFMPAMQEASKLHGAAGGGHTGAGADETPMARLLQKNANFMLGRPKIPPVPWRGLAGSAGVGAVMSAAADPGAFTDMATHPLNTLGAVGNAAIHPQQTWAPSVGEGYQRLTNDYMNTGLELPLAVGQTLGMKAAMQGGMNIGDQYAKYLANFGTGYTADAIGTGLRTIGNKISDAWHDPGGGFGR